MTLAEELAELAVRTAAAAEEAAKKQAEAEAAQRAVEIAAESQELYGLVITSCKQAAGQGQRAYSWYQFSHTDAARDIVIGRLLADGFAVDVSGLYAVVKW